MSSLIVEVCEIKEIIPHPNADRLDIVTCKGWNSIVSRDEYKVGDLCVFFPPDSILPDNLIEKYKLEFLKKGGRVGTLKLRGYISQGLILPVECVPALYRLPTIDVTNVLGVTKYEPPAPKGQGFHYGEVSSRKVQNPNFTKYTDIENIQNFDTVFQEGDLVSITEKVHGSNIRFGWLPIEINWKSGDWFAIARSLFRKHILGEKYEFVYGSHNVQLQWDNQKTFFAENIYAKVIAQEVEIESLPKGYLFYGEVFGKGVQELDYGLDGLGLVIFDVKDEQGSYLTPAKAHRICFVNGLTPVPEYYAGPFFAQILKTCTEGNSVICTEQIREGCVVKSMLETNHPRIGRMILKSINPEYLARKNRTEYH